MKTVSIKHDKWDIECKPDDGARISVLRHTGNDLLTAAPADFKAPSANYGEYEKRPVYGCDDCFPSVDIPHLSLRRGVFRNRLTHSRLS